MPRHVRWCFNATKWKPTKDQWLQLSASVPCDELDRINKFVFQEDAKTSLMGQVMIRTFLSKYLESPSNQIDVVRNHHGKPELSVEYAKTSKVKVNFNVSHSGDHCVLVGYHDNSENGQDVKLGVDVTQIIKKKSREELDRFLGLMSKREFLPSEWKLVENAQSDRDKCIQFTRLWCLKESYIKAIGLGLAFDLRRIEFVSSNIDLVENVFSTSTFAKIDGIANKNWKFIETRLDENHLIAIAYHGISSEHDSSLKTKFDEISIDEIIDQLTPNTELNDENWNLLAKKQIKVKR